MKNCHVGTSGYAYREWKGSFYPAKIKPAEMLACYAETFDTVELNHTFRALPAPGALAKLVDQVPPAFRFSVKAPEQITHRKRLRECAAPVTELRAAVEELGATMGALLFQLPPNLKKDLPRLVDFLALLEGGPRATFEFRHATWFADEVYEALAHAGAALCIAESDALETPRVATAKWGYLRLRKEAYSPKALAACAEWMGAQGWTETFVYFKHEETARGTVLGKKLQQLLAG